MKKGYLEQYLTSGILGLATFICGYSIVWPSYTIPLFRSDLSPLSGNFTTYHQSLLGSVPMLGSLLGTVFGGLIADNIGRKRGEILSGLFNVLSCALICTARNIYLLVASRFIFGFGGGIHTFLYSIYVGEFSSAAIRGTTISICVFGYSMGVLSSYIVGWLLTYEQGNYLILGINIMFVISMFFVKDTPVYYLKIGKDKEALECLKFYRGTKITNQEVLDEFAEMKSLLHTPQQMILLKDSDTIIDDPEKEKLRETKDVVVMNESKANVWKTMISSKANLRIFVVISALIFLSVSMGMIAIQTYAGILFARAVPDLSSDMCAIAVALANIAGSVLPIFMIDVVGRRIMMIVSAVLTSLCLAALGSVLRWPIAPDWMIPAIILLYCFCFQLGSAGVPYMLNAEAYLPEVKSLCIILAYSVMWGANFIMLAIFAPLSELVGLDGTFFFYSGIAAIAAVLSVFVLPETTGLTVDMIQAKFTNGFLQIGQKSKQ